MPLTDDRILRSFIEFNGSDVGDLAYSDPRDGGNGMDVAAYTLQDNVNYDVNGTIDVPDISGYWTFSGLSDATSGDTVPANAHGATSGTVNNKVRRTNRSDKLEYQAAFEKNRDPTSGGDSGMPWIDDDGDVICQHWGDKTTWLGETWNVGGVAQYVLRRGSAYLSPNTCLV
ncbi:hypothetical protein [Halomicrobium sp. LC1Hm]|uniref:hypothetical protein n=1 Tax=Halomicrobium sp. LC1Hm TaxID=2610902 RepID=UPI0012984CB0|nr:hypothetical protein [Halomicrobium sp. LC1Hm]